jgi:hypothetical protein
MILALYQKVISTERSPGRRREGILPKIRVLAFVNIYSCLFFSLSLSPRVSTAIKFDFRRNYWSKLSKVIGMSIVGNEILISKKLG